MIGEKLKPHREEKGEDKKSKKTKFDDFFFSDIIAQQEHKMSFFACDTVKSIIDS
jgi:hypothetical protein